MSTMKVASSSNVALRSASRHQVVARPLGRCLRVRVQASKASSNEVVSKVLAVSTAAATLLYSGNANAATELMNVAASDGRGGIIAGLFLPALAWVGFNMLQPLNNQLSKMNEERESARRGVAAALGLGAASLFLAENADAATQIAQIADNDGRAGTIFLLFVPALAWVGFNMLQPLSNQLNKMSEERDSAKRGVAAALGLGAASMFLAENADAATQIAQIADNDGRAGTIFLLFVPALAWVGFNMLQPLSNQLNKMSEERDSAKRGVAAALGLGAASMFLAENADAATQIAQVASNDGRAGTIFLLFVPALAWVGFNMLQPLSNQLNKMSEDKATARQ